MSRLSCCHRIYLILLNNFNNLIILTIGCRYSLEHRYFMLRKESHSFHENFYSDKINQEVTLKHGIIFWFSQQISKAVTLDKIS